MGPLTEQRALIGSALRLGHQTSLRYSVVPANEPSHEPSHERSCEEKGSSEASHEPSYESSYHLKVHKALDEPFSSNECSCEGSEMASGKVHEGWAPTSI